MSTFLNDREIFPVKDENMPKLLDDVRGESPSTIVRVIAADMLEYLWLREREWRRAAAADVAAERAKKLSGVSYRDQAPDPHR